MKTAEYCAAAKRKLKISSDYELAKRLGVSKQSISNYVNEHRVFDATTAAKIAEILKLDPLVVIADAEIERGTNDELWRRIAKRVAMVLFAAGAASSGGFNSNGIASPSAPAGESALSSGPEYTLCNKRRKRLAGWCTWLGLALASSLA